MSKNQTEELPETSSSSSGEIDWNDMLDMSDLDVPDDLEDSDESNAKSDSDDDGEMSDSDDLDKITDSNDK